MLDIIIPKIKGFLFNPIETFRNSRTDESRTVASYFGVLLLFYAGLIAVLEMTLFFFIYLMSEGFASRTGTSYGTPAGTALAMVFLAPVFVFFAILIGGSLLLLLFGIWTHLWVYLLGGRQGVRQTLHAVFYSMTPALLLGWIPLVGMFASFWALILMFFGIREYQELSDGRTAAVIFFSVIIPIIVLIALFILALIVMASPGGLFSPSSAIQ